MTTRTEPATIWLAPWCAECERKCFDDQGRTWCEDEVYGPCDDCGARPVKYAIVADAFGETSQTKENQK